MSKILLVEDDALIKLMLRDMLARHGFEVIEADNGAHALGLLLRDASVCAVITDILMPVVNGLELTREVKRLYPMIPVIVITAYPNNAAEAFARGADSYMAKPFAMKDLISEISRVTAFYS